MRLPILLLAPTLTLVLAGCSSSSDESATPSEDCSTSGTDTAALECQVLELVNQSRAQGTVCNGVAMPPVPPLAMHPILRQVARAHAEDMAQNGYFAHQAPSGTSPADRVTAAGYDWGAVGENIAGGKATAEGTMQQWLTSTSGHCENIMDDKFVHIGVGHAYSETHQYGHLWVQNFAAPLE